MENTKRTPHKWAKEIEAWANGQQVERKCRNDDDWYMNINSIAIFDDPNCEFRICDPLREVKEAFERGDNIQTKISTEGGLWIREFRGLEAPEWEDFPEGEEPSWSENFEWRVKPKERNNSMRATGKTTRLINEAIEQLFQYGEIYIPNQTNSLKIIQEGVNETCPTIIEKNQSNMQIQQELFDKIIARLELEHEGQFDVHRRIIKLKNHE